MVGPKCCCVVGCITGTNKDRKQRKRSGEKMFELFCLPRFPPDFKQWASVIPTGNKVLQPSDRICELHFAEEDIVRYYSNQLPDGSLSKIECERLKLKSGAVPKNFTELSIPKNTTKSEQAVVHNQDGVIKINLENSAINNNYNESSGSNLDLQRENVIKIENSVTNAAQEEFTNVNTFSGFQIQNRLNQENESTDLMDFQGKEVIKVKIENPVSDEEPNKSSDLVNLPGFLGENEIKIKTEKPDSDDESMNSSNLLIFQTEIDIESPLIQDEHNESTDISNLQGFQSENIMNINSKIPDNDTQHNEYANLSNFQMENAIENLLVYPVEQNESTDLTNCSDFQKKNRIKIKIENPVSPYEHNELTDVNNAPDSQEGNIIKMKNPVNNDEPMNLIDVPIFPLENMANKNLVSVGRLIQAPNHWWGINVTPEFIICCKWNATFSCEIRVAIEKDFKYKVFIKDHEISTDNMPQISSREDISLLLLEVDRFKICPGISDKSMTKCMGYLTPKTGFEFFCKACQLFKKAIYNRRRRLLVKNGTVARNYQCIRRKLPQLKPKLKVDTLPKQNE